MSGDVRVERVQVPRITVNTISGDIIATEVTAGERDAEGDQRVGRLHRHALPERGNTTCRAIRAT